jgi:hypothetical protein
VKGPRFESGRRRWAVYGVLVEEAMGGSSDVHVSARDLAAVVDAVPDGLKFRPGEIDSAEHAVVEQR